MKRGICLNTPEVFTRNYRLQVPNAKNRNIKLSLEMTSPSCSGRLYFTEQKAGLDTRLFRTCGKGRSV